MRLYLDVLALLGVLTSSALSMSPFTRSLIQRVSRRHRRAMDQSFPPCKAFGCVHGDCTVKDNIFNCECHSGYKGQLCNEIDIVKDTQQGKTDECFANFICNNGGKCLVSKGHFGVTSVKCLCPPQWTGAFCDIPCTMDCMNGGTCHKDRMTGKEMCICKWAFTGTYCQTENIRPKLDVI